MNRKTQMDLASHDLAACRALLRGGSRTFFAASLLLPANVRDPASALYAFCRLADDAVDLDDTAPLAAIARLRERLDRAYAGRPLAVAADRAFAAAIARHNIPRALPEALIEGFEWDAAGRRYETIEDLHGYGARVAGSVGAMMALVMGRSTPGVVARACELGMAMQLSNIARDVGEDARAGRLYLPRQWMREAGIDPEGWLTRPVYSVALGAVIRRVLDEADRLYARSGPGIANLPVFCRPGIRTARLLYAEIGHQVARDNCDSVSRRAVVSGGRKVQLLMHSLVARDGDAGNLLAPVLAEAQFLIDAVANRHRTASPDFSAEQAGGWIGWLVELFDRLERQDRLRVSRRLANTGYRPRSVPQRLA